MAIDLAAPSRTDVDSRGEITASPYFNADLAPTTAAQRTWRLRDMGALWVAMAACVPTYMLASSLIDEGMNWWQAVLTIVFANVIVLVPMILNGHAGTKYGIPFPVYCRAAFGLRGANVPALLRAFVACGWFGIQAWIGGWAIYKILEVYQPSWKDLPTHSYFAINLPQFLCFLFFWAINLFVIYRGIDSIRLLLQIKAPLLIALGLALLAWAYREAGGLGPMLDQPSQFEAGGPKSGGFWRFFFPALTANVGSWATLSLNIPDFTRYARSQRDQALGQTLALPPAMGLFSFIGVAVTSGTIVIFGKPIWDPVELVARFGSWSPIRPCTSSKWLIAYSALLGAVGGVLVADYFLVRRTRLDVPGLYREDGPYWYRRGFHAPALVALAAGVAPCLPGFLATVAEVKVPAGWTDLYNYAWFVSFGLSFAVYAAWMRLTARCSRGR